MTNEKKIVMPATMKVISDASKSALAGVSQRCWISHKLVSLLERADKAINTNIGHANTRSSFCRNVVEKLAPCTQVTKDLVFWARLAVACAGNNLK